MPLIGGLALRARYRESSASAAGRSCCCRGGASACGCASWSSIHVDLPHWPSRRLSPSSWQGSAGRGRDCISGSGDTQHLYLVTKYWRWRHQRWSLAPWQGWLASYRCDIDTSRRICIYVVVLRRRAMSRRRSRQCLRLRRPAPSSSGSGGAAERSKHNACCIRRLTTARTTYATQIRHSRTGTDALDGVERTTSATHVRPALLEPYNKQQNYHNVTDAQWVTRRRTEDVTIVSHRAAFMQPCSFFFSSIL